MQGLCSIASLTEARSRKGCPARKSNEKLSIRSRSSAVCDSTRMRREGVRQSSCPRSSSWPMPSTSMRIAPSVQSAIRSPSKLSRTVRPHGKSASKAAVSSMSEHSAGRMALPGSLCLSFIVAARGHTPPFEDKDSENRPRMANKGAEKVN